MRTEDPAAEWARLELEHLTAIPEYGSRQWLNLEPTDPRRTAALITAAENWRHQQEGTTHG